MHALNRRLMLTTTIGGLAAAALPIPALAQTTAPADTEWRSYGNDLAHTRHAPLDQINGNNFNKLEVAWEFSTKNLGPRAEVILQGTPLLIKAHPRLRATWQSAADEIREAIVALSDAAGPEPVIPSPSEPPPTPDE